MSRGGKRVADQPHQLGGTMAVERFTLQLHDENDADIVEYLEKKKHSDSDSMNGAMKRALRAQMEAEK